MTEQQWLTGNDPEMLLDYLQRNHQPSPRKLRLFAAACSRRVWQHIDDLGRAAVEMAEYFADHLAGPDELRAARLACKGAGGRASWYAAASDPFKAATNAARSARMAAGAEEATVQAAMVRDIFGNPWQTPPLVDAGWLTVNEGEAKNLALEVYETRQFAGFPQLGSLLEQGGCRDGKLLDHLRAKNFHVRGCWALDLFIGKQ
jgi:hypothetical protein